MTNASDPASKRQGSASTLQRLWSWVSGVPAISDIRNVADSATNSARILGAQIARANQMDVLFEELKQHVWESFRQIAEANQRLAETNQRLAESLAEISRNSDATRAQVQGLRREIMFQQHRLSRLGESISISESAPSQIGKDLYDERIDSLYVAFEDVFRGSRDDIKSRLAPYLEQIKQAGLGGPDKPILDIGCGRGEWLELLREHGLEAYGVDLNSMMIERSLAVGLKAQKADAVAHLRELPDQSLGGLTAFHFIEHIPFEVFVNFLDEALRVLTPGGVVILETPNPETIRVGATTFYYDPTHRNPLPPVPTKFIVEHRGFVDVEIIRLHPVIEEQLQALDENAEVLNRVLFGPQDYAIIARRDVGLNSTLPGPSEIPVDLPATPTDQSTS